MIKLNRQKFFDQVYGCWIGKSIGGTLGTPYEGRRELLDIHDFASPPGKPLPNDDLDLQLVWLKALEEKGPLGVNERVLGEYWLNYIPPQWNEYGLGKSNMRSGLLPPLSGEHENIWKHSNGAWIRSEIWACSAPACPELATKYAWYDACVDHGTGEGTYAELFTAAVESAAFVETDRDKLIQIGLSYLPPDCRVARSINLALDGYARGLSWQETRQTILEDSADLGWFQAPANLAYVIVGWLYGAGDFKRSLLIAVSCGDDTDCTGATLGSILGIIQGAAALPADWRRHVGDDLITVAIDRGSMRIPETCTALTERTIRMTEQVLAAHRVGVALTDDEAECAPDCDLTASAAYRAWLAGLCNDLVFDFIHTRVSIAYLDGVNIGAGQETHLRLTLINQLPDPRHVSVTWHLPEGFALLDGPRHINQPHRTSATNTQTSVTVTLRAGTSVAAENRGVIQMVAAGRPTVMLIPLLFFGI
jgi:ADP-ribosylglycohydrolase